MYVLVIINNLITENILNLITGKIILCESTLKILILNLMVFLFTKLYFVESYKLLQL